MGRGEKFIRVGIQALSAFFPSCRPKKDFFRLGIFRARQLTTEATLICMRNWAGYLHGMAVGERSSKNPLGGGLRLLWPSSSPFYANWKTTSTERQRAKITLSLRANFDIQNPQENYIKRLVWAFIFLSCVLLPLGSLVLASFLLLQTPSAALRHDWDLNKRGGLKKEGGRRGPRPSFRHGREDVKDA